jgi:predicted N-acetyltransferase YhbS
MTDEFRLVETGELDAMFDLRARAFERGTGSEWAAYVEGDPWRDAGADLVAVSDGVVVATMRLLGRRVAGLDGELRLAGIGAVSSDPAVRRRGYVRRLLALAHERSRAAGYDLAMLFTGSPWVYSGAAGFSTLPFWWLDLDVGRLPVPDGKWTVEPADPRRHLAGMQQVYEQFGAGRPGYPLRGPEYWTHPARLTDPTWMRVALDRNERVVAYLRVRLSPDGRAIVQECPYLAAAAVDSLGAAIAQDPVLGQCSTLGGRLPRDHVLGHAGQWRPRDDAMACPYTDAGSQLLEALRGPTNQHTVYWSHDGF